MTSFEHEHRTSSTERRDPATRDLHARSVAGILDAFGTADLRAVEAVAEARPALTALIEAAEPGFVRGGRLVYLGAGTSGRLGVLDASEAPPTFDVDEGRVVGLIAGGDAALRRSSEASEDDPNGAQAELDGLALTDDDTVVGIAASGRTPYVLGALAHAKSRAPGAVTGLVCCTEIAAPPPGCDHLVELLTGPEVLTGSTRLKAGTATKLVLNAISTALMVRAGRVHENLMVDVRATNAKLRARAIGIVRELTDLDATAAGDLLERAGGSCKVAVAMHHLGLERDAAVAALARVAGRLGDVL
ncbi:N-acetylmuramic acid 6-phosphate etherase [Planctomycetes bacterium Pla163]|uniref:N-acetylmuramic acid 6-phosphate etherase n=1 Tax=Rohdeia mirabilis TaxID=2528008 RepID=A0A518D0W2_9BACT|nr:N-acetylmuramic acid 6-phosphate etherase [Planctomycetes bacterium Pla163]